MNGIIGQFRKAVRPAMGMNGFTNTVEDDDRFIHGVAKDRQDRRKEGCIDFQLEECKDTEHHQDIMADRYDRRQCDTMLKADRHIEDHRAEGQDDIEKCILRDLRTDHGTDKEEEFIKEIYSASQSISIDYAVLEKADNVTVLRVDGIGWTDLGTWGSLYDVSPKNHDGNVLQGTKTMMMNSHNNIVSTQGDKLVVVSELDDYIIADSENALLIVPRSEEQKIRTYVREVKATYGDEYK